MVKSLVDLYPSSDDLPPGAHGLAGWIFPTMVIAGLVIAALGAIVWIARVESRRRR